MSLTNKLECKRIIECVDLYRPADKILAVLEFMDGGSFTDIIDKYCPTKYEADDDDYDDPVSLKGKQYYDEEFCKFTLF